MVLSFKISRFGTRYRPKPKPQPETAPEPEVDEPAQLPAEVIPSSTAPKRSADAIEDDCSIVAENSEVSFILNIFSDGYTIVNPSESNAEQDDPPQFLHPYDRRSESMITGLFGSSLNGSIKSLPLNRSEAIECGYLPTDLLEDIDCKYINGTVHCEVRDYRKESSESAVNDSVTVDFPSVTKLSLKMSLDNVVKDIHLISDSTWEYGDLLEAEARILIALQPKLYLDPTPNIDRLCREPTSTKLNLDIRGKRLKRLRQESAPENSNSRVRDSKEVTGQPDLVNLVDQNVGQSNIAARPTNHAPLYSSVIASRHITGQPVFVNLIDENAGQSNMLATGPKNHAPENSRSSVRDSRHVMAQPDLVNLVKQNVGQRTVVATGHKNHAPENSSSSVRDSRHVMGQPDLVDQSVGQRTVVATGHKNHAAENSSSSVRDSRHAMGQPHLVNLVEQNVGQRTVVATGHKNHAPEDSSLSVRDSRHVMGQPDLVDQSVGQRTVVATGHKNHAAENSSSRVRDSRHATGQPHLVNLVEQNVGQRTVVATGHKNHAPENSNMRVGELGWISGQPNLVNLIDQNVSQSNMIPTWPQNRVPYTASSSFFHQSGQQIGVGKLLNMQDPANDINSSSIMSSANDKRRNHCQVLSTVNLSKRGRSTNMGLDDNQHMDNIQRVPQQFERNRSHQHVPQQFTRSNFHKAPWNNMSPNLESNTTGKEFSSGSKGLQLGAGATSVPVVGEAQFFTFSPNESLQQAQMAANWRSITLQTTPVISGLGSSSSVGNMIGPSTAATYPVHTSMQDRFSMIKMLTARYKLNCKNNKIDEYKPTILFSTQQLKHVLIDDHDDYIPKDETCKMPLSMSLTGGNINICKTRVLIFLQNEHSMPENGLLGVPKFHTRLILSERHSDGTVAMHLGDLDDVDYLADDQLLPTLPNTHMADLLAAQFCVLMLRDGYHLEGDHLKPKQISMVSSAGGQPNTTPGDFNAWLLQILEGDPSESFYEVAEPSVAESSHHHIHPQSIGLFPGVSTSRMHPYMVNNYRESQLQTQLLKQQEQCQIQRTMMMRPDHNRHSIGGDNFSMVGFQGLGMGGGGHAGTSTAVSPVMSQNPMATNQGLGQINTNVPAGQVGQCSNFGGLQGANKQIHLGSGSGSGSSGVSMLGSGTGINRANVMSAFQRNVIERLNQNRYKNLQQFQLIKQEPTSSLQAVLLQSQQAGSPSSSIGGSHQKAGPHQPTP